MQFNKQWKEILMEERYPDLLLEARVRDVKAKYPALNKLGYIEKVRHAIQSTMGPKGVSKYLLWVTREIHNNFDGELEEYEEYGDALELNNSDVDEVMRALLQVVEDFQSNQQRLEQRDIYKYNSGELQYLLDKLGVSKRAKLKSLKDKEAAEEGSTMIYNDHGIMAIRPETMQASCYYGHNPRLTTWCISTKSERNYFDQYTKDEGKAFVITRFFGIPEGSDNHIIALQFDHDGDLQMFWDAPNESRDPDDLYIVIVEHLRGLEEYKDVIEKGNQGEPDFAKLVREIYLDLMTRAKDAIQDDPPPNAFEATEAACEEIRREALSDLEYVDVYYEVQDDYLEGDAPYVWYAARVEFDMDISSEAYTEAPNKIADIDYGAARALEDKIESRLRDAGIYDVEDFECYQDNHDETSLKVQFKIHTGDADPSTEGFREFVNFTAAQFENQVDDIQQIINSVLMEGGYYVPAGQQMRLPGIEEEVQRYFKHNHLTKQAFFDSIERDLVKEEKGRSRQRGIYKFYCMLTYGLTIEQNKSRGLDDILADLRALPNVTIVTVVVKNQKIGEGKYIAGLSIKFIPSIPGQFNSPEDVKARVIRDIRKLANVQNLFKVSAGLERLE